MRTLKQKLNQNQSRRMKPIATVVGTALLATLATACSTDTVNDASVAAKELTDGYDVVSTSNLGSDGVSGVGSNSGELHDGVAKTAEDEYLEALYGDADGGDSEHKSGSKCADGKCGAGYDDAGAADGAFDVAENQ